MKIFLDTSNVEEIRAYSKLGIVDGITTNPTTLSKSGRNPLDTVVEICSIMHGKDVSVEVTESEPEKVFKQAKEIFKIADNVVVKIPCHKDYYEIIKILVHEGVHINVTLVFSLMQSLYMAKLGVKYISPFVGRLDDIGEDGLELIAEVKDMLVEYDYSTQLLAASIRSVASFKQVINLGADIVTLPVKVLEESFVHQLTDQGIKKFQEDWSKLNITKFP